MAGFLGDWNEGVRLHEAQLRVTPAHQGLEAHDPA
jgi:hypothetical protein